MQWENNSVGNTIHEAPPRQEQRFFGIKTPGMCLKGCDLHQRLPAAYAKLRH